MVDGWSRVSKAVFCHCPLAVDTLEDIVEKVLLRLRIEHAGHLLPLGKLPKRF